MSKKLLLDADCGTDDAQAIMLALAAPSVELLGITCVHGNTTVENVCRNTLRVLQACSKLEVGAVGHCCSQCSANVYGPDMFTGGYCLFVLFLLTIMRKLLLSCVLFIKLPNSELFKQHDINIRRWGKWDMYCGFGSVL